MKSVKMDFVRDGPDRVGVEKDRTYHVVIESSEHRQFKMPLAGDEFHKLLAELRYHAAISETKRKAALKKLSQTVTKILKPPKAPPGGVQLDLLTNARELWAVPFEAALAANGKPLLCQRESVVTLTRRMPRQFSERLQTWPARPRVLFAYASPDWIEAHPVDFPAHYKVLFDTLEPWMEPMPGETELTPGELSVLTCIADASLVKIELACRTAEREKRPYTHIHLLAHGIEIEEPGYDYKKRYGIALESPTKKPTKPEALVRAIWPANRQGQELPLVVTLAICDGGNAENTIIDKIGLAQDLHGEGVPIVLASQFPLTFAGAEIMTRMFYQGWMEGRDVRVVLHETRLALHESKNTGHDCVSMVAYARLPEGYTDYLLALCLKSQFAALETATKYARELITKKITDPLQFDKATKRMQGRIRKLKSLLKEQAGAPSIERKDLVAENAGQLGSGYKRLAEFHANRAKVDPKRAKRWIAQSRSAFTKARDAYRKGFQRNTSDDWTGVQYLTLDGVLTGIISNTEDFYACTVAARAKQSNPSISEEDKIWALGSIAELALLSSLTAVVQGTGRISPGEGRKALVELKRRVKARRPVDLFPIVSTQRQLNRYVDFWTKANGFFSERRSDLAAPAKQLIKLLED